VYLTGDEHLIDTVALLDPLKEVEPEVVCSLYPVPSRGSQNVVLQTNVREIQKKMRIYSFDLLGRKVFEQALVDEKTNLKFEYPGLYKILVVDETGNRLWHGTAIVNE
jgi:hypothetical protein